MIVVTGNWMISDGTLSPPPARGALEPLFGEVARLACMAGVSADGTYRPIERIDLVLAGDTFDGLTSRRWLGRVRPWHGGSKKRETVDGVLFDAVRAGRGPLARLGSLARSGIRVPAADRRRRPILNRSVPVPVRVSLIPGDRDALLERPLAAAASRYDFSVGSLWERIGDPEGHVVVRHGHEFDPLCLADVDQRQTGSDREPVRFGRRPSLSESLAVDWLAVFAAGLAATPCPTAVARRVVRELTLGPWTSAPAIFIRLLVEDRIPADMTGILIESWRRSVDHWHAAATADPPCSAAGFDAVGALSSWMQRVDVPRRGHPRADSAELCADGWLDIRRRDLVPFAPKTGLVVLGHPPRGFSHGSIVSLGPVGDGTPGNDGPGSLRIACEPSPVVEIRAAGTSSTDTPAWVAVPWRGVGRGIVSSTGWIMEAA